MKKLILILLLCPTLTFSQNITLDFLLKSRDYPLEKLAEKLISNYNYQSVYKRKFVKYSSEPKYRSFRYNPDLDYKNGYTNYNKGSYVEVTFHAKPYDDYKKLRNKIRTKLNKTDFWFCSYFKTYITQFESSDGAYVYLWQNKVEEDQDYENYCITVSSSSLKGRIFFISK